MSFKNRARLHAEQLESRVVPSVDRSMGTFSLVGQWGVNNYMIWKSPDQAGNKALSATASQAATYEFTKDELALARSNAGLTLTEEVRWREDDGLNDETVKKASAAYKWTIAATATGGFIHYAPDGWSTSVDNYAGGLFEGSEAEFYGWINEPAGPSNYSSSEIWMEYGVAAGGNGTTGYINGTSGVGYADLSAFANPAFPDLAPSAAGYRVLAFNSQDGTDFTVSAANTSGYNLLAASSSALAWDANAEDLVIPQTTSFATAYSTGSTTGGLWAGGETAWVVRNAAEDKTFYLTGYAYSKMPAALLGLADGQSTTVSGGSLEEGNDVLWLTFETDGETVSFMLVGHPTNSAPTVDDATSTVLRNGTLNIPLSAIDSDGDLVTVTGVTQGTNGTVTFTPNGVTYTPNANFTGTDSFTYTVSDGYGGTDTATVDVTVVQPATVIGRAWSDANLNGLQDVSEAGVEGVEVRLYDAGGNVVATTSTDANGNYTFANLLPGSYRVRFIAPPLYSRAALTTQNAGSDDSLDSDADSLGYTDFFTLLSGQEDDRDAGFTGIPV